jgi:hypothetical protein
MNRFHSYILVGFSLVLMFEATAQEARLSYDLKPGDSYMLDIDLQQNTRSESMNSEEISLYSRTKIEFRVDSMNEGGDYHMTVHYRDLLVSMIAPRMEVDINSSNGRNLMLSNMVDSLTVGNFQVVMNQGGDLKSIEGMDALFESMAAYPAKDTNEQLVILKTLEETFGPDSFKSLFSLFISVYPVIQPMTSWTNNITYYFNTKPVMMVNRYNLSRTTQEALTIQGMGMLNTEKEFQERTSMGEVKSAVSGSQTYDFQMDPVTGWIIRCVSRQRVKIESTITKSSYLPAGLKIPSYTETTFEVNGSKLQ